MITPSFGLTATERVLPRLALDWTTGLAQSGVDVTRAGVATFVGANGLIQSASADTQRIDYLTGTPGLLVEESRTNLCEYSQDISNVAWTKVNINTTGTPPYIDVEIAPDGTQTADKLIEAVSAGVKYADTKNATVTNSVHVFSIFGKKSERSLLQIYLVDSVGITANTNSIFNLDTGVVVSGTQASIVNYGNGWYRCVVYGTPAAGNCRARIIINGASNTGTAGFFIWGAQIEAGAFATSYIPTTTTAVTRNADVATMTGTNFSDWYNQTEGTFLTQFIRPPNIAASRPIEISDGTANNSMRLNCIANLTNVNWQVVVGGAVSANIATVGAATGAVCSMVGTYKEDEFFVAVNGGATAQDLSGLIYSSMDRMGLGGATFNSHLQKIMYWPHALTSAEVRAFSKV